MRSITQALPSRLRRTAHTTKAQRPARALPSFNPLLTENIPSCNHLGADRGYIEGMSWILVVEDEEDVSSFLRFVLENEDYRVVTAGSLAEARERLGALSAPSAVLLDRGLPDGDGLEICRDLKAGGKAPPVIVLSARKDPEELKEGISAGADDYIVKPFEFMNVLDRLRVLSA